VTRFTFHVLFFSTFLSLTVTGQDVHWSQFNDNQLFQNPGHAGNFKGDYRIIGNYRQQWKSVTLPFTTFSFSGDTRSTKNNKIGLGALIFNDVAGDGKFRTMEFQGNISYRLQLSADSLHTLRPGVNVGINHRQVNMNQFFFDNQYNGAFFDPSLPTNETYQNLNNTNVSIGLGTVYAYDGPDRKKLTSGIGFYNLNRPNQGFYGQKIKRDIRLSFFAKGQVQLTGEWDLLPSISLQMQGKYRELILGSSCKYTLVNQGGAYKALYLGTWFRNKDAGYLSVGMDYQSWFLGASYDFNVSKLVPASNARGGIEFAARYIIHRFKPKKILHRACPDYI
jgi:type IX secretion system PorP/SprF family membrane protein